MSNGKTGKCETNSKSFYELYDKKSFYIHLSTPIRISILKRSLKQLYKNCLKNIERNKKTFIQRKSYITNEIDKIFIESITVDSTHHWKSIMQQTHQSTVKNNRKYEIISTIINYPTQTTLLITFMNNELFGFQKLILIDHLLEIYERLYWGDSIPTEIKSLNFVNSRSIRPKKQIKLPILTHIARHYTINRQSHILKQHPKPFDHGNTKAVCNIENLNLTYKQSRSLYQKCLSFHIQLDLVILTAGLVTTAEYLLLNGSETYPILLGSVYSNSSEKNNTLSDGSIKTKTIKTLPTIYKLNALCPFWKLVEEVEYHHTKSLGKKKQIISNRRFLEHKKTLKNLNLIHPNVTVENIGSLYTNKLRTLLANEINTIPPCFSQNKAKWYTHIGISSLDNQISLCFTFLKGKLNKSEQKRFIDFFKSTLIQAIE